MMCFIICIFGIFCVFLCVFLKATARADLGMVSLVQSLCYFRAAWNANADCDEKAVCLSVCLSNACIVTKRKKDLSRFFTLYERSLSLVF